MMNSSKMILVMLSTLGAVSSANASPLTLSCSVLTNGNGRNWARIAEESKKIPSPNAEVKIVLPVASEYGDAFTLVATGMLTEIQGFRNAELSQHVTLADGAYVFSDLDSGTPGVVQPTGNIVDTEATFTSRRAEKLVTYSVTCSIR